jgi:heme-degrading monooxygenase HmoA
MARPEVRMYARVWKLGILPGKVEEFAAVIKSAIPILRAQVGFRSLVVVHGGPEEKLEATIVSVWDSLVHLRNSETRAYGEALAHLLTLCEHRPFMREEEVIVNEFASQDLSDTVTDF